MVMYQLLQSMNCLHKVVDRGLGVSQIYDKAMNQFIITLKSITCENEVI